MTGAPFLPGDMLDNAATAAQEIVLIDNRCLRGAVIRSVAQWIELNPGLDRDDLIEALRNSPEAGY